jgi:hypothetical protein
VTIAVEPRDGSRRFPDLNQVDLRVQREFKISSANRLDLFLDALNLNNSAKSENVGSVIATNTAFGVPTRVIAPRRLQLGMKVVW